MGEGEEPRAVVTNRPGGGVQEVRTRRKLFGKERRQIFLGHLAATCNVMRSAAAAGVTVQCVYQRRMRDAEFRAEWQAALEQGYARLEAMLIAHAAGEGPVEIDGSLDLGPPLTGDGKFDKDLALHLLREHKKGLAGIGNKGAAPRGADWSEVEAHFVGRLKALKERIGGAAEPLYRPALPDGPPPRGKLGEDL
jgi:hypothetical protein